MKIAVLYAHVREVGGTEAYLSSILPALAGAGHDIAYLHEVLGDSDRDLIRIPPGSPVWSVEKMGSAPAIAKLRDWKPDVLYAQGLTQPDLENQLLEIAPAILYVHSYYGACISGHKTTSFPSQQPCSRKFSPACLLQYFPRHCGGANPLTMLRAYQVQSQRQRTFPKYKMLLTNSEHMAREFRRYGLDSRCLYLFPRGEVKTSFLPAPTGLDPWRLLYLGRMSPLKGGDVLIDSLPSIQAQLQRPIQLTLAGNGPELEIWRKKARAVAAKHPNIQIDFPGWLNREGRERVLLNTHLHILPSLWPEPFGLSGLECGLRGIPSVAFAVGGIPEWLEDGVNGCLAPATSSKAHSLGVAIIRALENPDQFAILQQGALDRTKSFSLQKHLEALTTILCDAIKSSPDQADDTVDASISVHQSIS